MVFRFAPTPSGFLHEGNIFNFILIWLWARTVGAKILLRIDDLDSGRIRPEYVSHIFEVLDLLGLDYDMGPAGPDDFYKNWSQTARMDEYLSLINLLREKGHLFGCDCSRKMLVGLELYPGNCIGKGLDMDTDGMVWRMKTAFGDHIDILEKGERKGYNVSEICGNYIVKRRDEIPSFHIASFADDIKFGITHIVRGRDLLSSSVAQMHLGKLVDNNQFNEVQFFHHHLIVNQHGEKISKSAGFHKNKPSFSRAEIFQKFAFWMGWDDAVEPVKKALLTQFASSFHFR